MRVLHAPYSAKNPYQEQLINGLSARGHTVFTTDEEFGYLLKEAIQNGFFDIIHLHWISPIIEGRNKGSTIIRGALFCFALVLLRLAGGRIIWTIHNLTGHESNMGEFEITFYRYFLTYVADEAIVHSDSSKREVVREYSVADQSNKINVVNHGNYCNYYQNSVSQLEARSELGISEDAFVFLFFGQVRPYKNVPRLVESFSSLEEENARLVIAGNPASDELRARIDEFSQEDPRIKLVLRYIEDDEVQLFLNAADVVTLPYDEILTSGSAILAMSFGKPIIAPERGCLADIMPGSANYLYDPDSVALRDQLQMAISEREHLEEYGRKNLSVATRWDWNSVAKHTEEVYQAG